MKLKILVNNALNFSVNRVIEIIGIAIFITGVLLLASLITFSPDDPNFIFPDKTKIINILGFRGSFIADIFFQSLGVIALLIPFSLIVSGANIIFNNKVFLIIESIFYTILYSLLGSLFFSLFYPVAFNLYINGNGGFVGNYLETTFLSSLININSQISYFIIILLILILFLVSIQFKIEFFYNILKKILKNLFTKKKIIRMKMK
jgi:S-DNA-T family DNA segregation ATPase FtsK/SpoIIIE